MSPMSWPAPTSRRVYLPETVSLVDGFPTILDCVGQPPNPADADLPGASLFEIVRGGAVPRTVMSEYHAAGSATGAFMIPQGSLQICAICRHAAAFSISTPIRRRPGSRIGPAIRRRRRRLRGQAAWGRRSRCRRCPGFRRPGGTHRSTRRTRGDIGQGQFRFLAGPWHQAGLRRDGASRSSALAVCLFALPRKKRPLKNRVTYKIQGRVHRGRTGFCAS